MQSPDMWEVTFDWTVILWGMNIQLQSQPTSLLKCEHWIISWQAVPKVSILDFLHLIFQFKRLIKLLFHSFFSFGAAWPTPIHNGGYSNVIIEGLLTGNSIVDLQEVTLEPTDGALFNERDAIASDTGGQALNYTIKIDVEIVSTIASYIWNIDYSSAGTPM